MVDYRQGIPRGQLILYQHCIDEMVTEENIVRFIDAYIDSLDMYALGFRMNENKTGAPAYRPQLKLKIYVYGYLNGVRSSRGLERECAKNVELIWLAEGLAPDFKTIADFRKDNSKALKAVFKAFLTLCHKLELINLQTVAIDGTKMRGQNSSNEIYRRNQMEKIEQEIQEKIDGYLSKLDEVDELEGKTGVLVNEEKVGELRKRLEKQVNRKKKVEVIKELFEEDGQLRTYFATDEESRLQNDKGKIRPGYNVQTAVDDKHKLIVVAEVTNEQNDKRQLTPMIKQIEQQKEELGIEEKTCAVADAGYFSELEIMKNKDNEDCRPIVSPAAEGKTATVSKSGKGKEVPSAEYESDKFSYDDRRDMYKCPQNQELARITKTPAIDNNGRATHIYRCSPEICAQCQARELCTKSQSGRMLRVSANQKEMLEYLDGLQEKENKNLVGKRKEIVEHPFGTLKRSLGYTYFLLRGLEKTAAEFSLMCFTYNLKRATKILGVRRLIEAIT